MRIGVDYRLSNRHLGGMAVYLRNLIPLLKRVDSRNEYLVFNDNPSGRPGFKRHAWTIIWEHLWLQLCLPFLFWKEKIDAAYFPNPPVSFFLTKPVVLTIADVAFVHDPSLPRWIRGYLWLVYFLSAHKAKIITTFSQNSRRDAAKLFGVRTEKIQVIPLAASDTIGPNKNTKKKNYIISVPGTFIPRKNVKETILAFHRLPVDIRRNFRLILVGYNKGGEFEKLKIFVDKLNMAGKVDFVGRVDDKRLSILYSQARLFVCSSLYEGFGLPILEAMKCGTPVVSYNNSSLPEVVGEAGILVDNSTGLSKAMERVLKDQSLQDDLKRKGQKHVKLYSWHKTAGAFLKTVFENVD